MMENFLFLPCFFGGFVGEKGDEKVSRRRVGRVKWKVENSSVSKWVCVRDQIAQSPVCIRVTFYIIVRQSETNASTMRTTCRFIHSSLSFDNAHKEPGDWSLSHPFTFTVQHGVRSHHTSHISQQWDEWNHENVNRWGGERAYECRFVIYYLRLSFSFFPSTPNR